MMGLSKMGISRELDSMGMAFDRMTGILAGIGGAGASDSKDRSAMFLQRC
jgi:hypothetical protein